MTILVTGGAGFIGSHLVRALHARGEDVRALDDLSTGAAANLPAGVPLIRGDVRVRTDVEAALAGVSQVYHLAAAVGPALVAAAPNATWSRNVGGTRTVLDAGARVGASVFLASSSEVYHPAAAAKGLPLAESARTGVERGDRRGVYARSKLVGEAAGRRLARRGLRVTCGRFFNVVGARQSARHGMVLARFARAANRGEPLPVYGDGGQRRCFLHVEDAVRAILAVAGHPEAVGRAVNIGSADEVTVLELARRVAALTGHPGTVRFIPVARVYGAGFRDPRVRRPAVGLLQRMTGWRARCGLDTAIRDAVAATPSCAAWPLTRRRGHPRKTPPAAAR